MASAHQNPDTPRAHPDMNDVRDEGDRQAQYAEYVRACWLAHQFQANQEAAEVTRRVIRQRKSA